MIRRHLSRTLAIAFLSGPWEFEVLRAAGVRVLGSNQRWVATLVERVLHAFKDPPLPERAVLTEFIDRDRGFRAAWTRRLWSIRPAEYVAAPTPHVPARGAPETWDVPPWRSVHEVAGWLGITVPQLDGFADPRTFGRRARPGPLRNYDYRWIARPSGLRLIEMPRRRLKEIQRLLLHEVLDRIPPHEAAHGFRPGRSMATCLAGHAGRELVVRMDLASFFPSIRAARVLAIFRTAGYPDDVATVLTGLATARVPDDVLEAAPREGLSLSRRWKILQHYRFAHLPQAPRARRRSPTSARGGSTGGSPASRARPTPGTRATPTTSSSPATASSAASWAASSPGRARSSRTRGSWSRTPRPARWVGAPASRSAASS